MSQKCKLELGVCHNILILPFICFLQFHLENAHLLNSAKTVHRLIKPLQKPGRFLLPLLNFEQQNKNIISDKKVFNASYTFFDVVTESKIKFHEIFHNFSSIMSSGGTKNLGWLNWGGEPAPATKLGGKSKLIGKLKMEKLRC